MHAKVIELKFLTNLVSTLDKRIDTLHQLGKLFKYFLNKKRFSYEFWLESLRTNHLAYQYNNWFTKEYIFLSLNNWSKELNKNNLISWIKKYNTKDCSDKTVAIIMAGNLPLVGFHDFICAIY